MVKIDKMTDIYKKCCRCKQTKPIDEFHVDLIKKDGRYSSCKICVKECFKERYEKNKEAISIKRKRQYKEDQIFRENMKERVRKYYDEHRDAKLTYQKEYNKNHKKERKVYLVKYWKTSRCKYLKARWKFNNLEKSKLIDKKCYFNRKAIKRQSNFNYDEWVKILLEYNYKCAYCGKESKNLEQDHVIPLSKGGLHTKENIVPACRSCNASKNNKILEDWIMENKKC
jgi:hypothetical protein